MATLLSGSRVVRACPRVSRLIRSSVVVNPYTQAGFIPLPTFGQGLASSQTRGLARLRPRLGASRVPAAATQAPALSKAQKIQEEDEQDDDDIEDDDDDDEEDYDDDDDDAESVHHPTRPLNERDPGLSAKASLTRSYFRHGETLPKDLEDRIRRMVETVSPARISNDYLARVHAPEEDSRLPLPTYDPRTTLAYIAGRFPRNYTNARRALRESIMGGWIPPSRPLVVLDYGSGPATATLAAHSLLKLRESTLVDPSLPMLDAAKKLTEGVLPTNWARSLVEVTRGLVSRQGAARYDLVLCTHVLSELKSQETRSAALALLWETVAPGGLLLVMESGSPTGAEVVRQARAEALSFPTEESEKYVRSFLKDESDSREPGEDRRSKKHALLSPEQSLHRAFPVAPCGHCGECPLKGRSADPEEEEEASRIIKSSHWCHFNQRSDPLVRWASTTGKMPISAKRTNISFSYVALMKQGREAPPSEMQLRRILRTPIKRRGVVLLDVCGDQGEVERITVRKKETEIYPDARDAEQGGAWPY